MQILLDTTGAAPELRTYRDVGQATKKAFVCQTDIAVRIGLAAFGRSGTYYGPLWSYGTPPSSPANPGMSVTAPGAPVCSDYFTPLSGQVACRQLGYDLATQTNPGKLMDQSAGSTIVGKSCLGSGEFCRMALNLSTIKYGSTQADTSLSYCCKRD